MYREFDLDSIRARGWVERYLKMQAENYTGEIDRVQEPFAGHYWGNPEITKEKLKGGYFLGGMFSPDDAWVPFEQTGYWIDAMVRAGYLADCEHLIEKAKSKIYPVIENADADGYLGPDFLKDGLVWSHAVYFRALMALYTATKDESILEALKKHFLRVPLKDVFEKQKDYFPVLYVRDIADIEIALWIYGQTGDKRFLDMAEESYAVFNEIFQDDTNARPAEEMRDVTIPGMLANRKVCRNHGVTYCEICKLPAILYLYTGKEIYKKAAVGAFEKLYRDQMLIDGVNSSTEYLNGNENSHAMHETCDVSDLTWALGYLYMITGDPKYGDRIEDAVFNAGLGSVDDDFTGNQYFSCPNQVISDDFSNHVIFYRGWPGWHSYAPGEAFGGCCAGNVHRFMPNLAARAWLLGENEAFAALYVPTAVDFVANGTHVKIEEKTAYPFENTVRFEISPEAPVQFTLTLRVPAWATSHTVTVNSEAVSEKAKKGLIQLNCTFKQGDVVTISFTDEIRFVENAKGVSVKKGALLYALPVKERVVIHGARALGYEKYPHYSLYAESDWNFGVNAADADATFVASDAGDEPWRTGDAGLSITLNAYRLPRWKLRYSENGLQRLHPRKGYVQKIGHKCVFTPRVPERVAPADVGEKCRVTLVPYAGTRLRVAIFPKVK